MISRSSRKCSSRWPTRLKPRLEAHLEIRSPDAVCRRCEAEPDRLRVHRERIEHLLVHPQLVVSRLHTHQIEGTVVERDEAAPRAGAFYLMGVKPGDYELRVDEQVLDAL